MIRPRFRFPALPSAPGRAVATILLALLLNLAGCSSDRPLNPSFSLLFADAKVALVEMRHDPKPLSRPVIIMGGIYDPGFAVASLASQVRHVTNDDDRVLAIASFGLRSFDACRDRVIERVQREYPSDDPEETVEVDVIAYSMGGLVARHAARPRTDGETRLKIRRLFTISSPHRGARMAGFPTFDRRVINMRPGSRFLVDLALDLSNADYELVPYTRLDDAVVGMENTTPVDRYPFWVANEPGSLSHVLACKDPRIMADILRRLRGEKPFTTEPAAPFPGPGNGHGPE